MSSQPENQFIQRVHKQLKKYGTYCEKNHNMYRGGTPDVFYSGDKGCLWIEYKFIKTVPTRDTSKVPIALSDLQDRWLANRMKEGRNVAVVIGCPQGGVVLQNEKWRSELNTAHYKANLLNVADIAKWIFSIAGSGCNDR